MTHYRLTSDGLVPHTVDLDAYRTYFANQAAGIPQSNTIPIKDAKDVKEGPKVVVKLVSDVQDTYERAKLQLKYKRLNKNKKTDGLLPKQKNDNTLKRKRRTADDREKKRRPVRSYAYGSGLGPPGRKLNF